MDSWMKFLVQWKISAVQYLTEFLCSPQLHTSQRSGWQGTWERPLWTPLPQLWSHGGTENDAHTDSLQSSVVDNNEPTHRDTIKSCNVGTRAPRAHTPHAFHLHHFVTTYALYIIMGTVDGSGYDGQHKCTICATYRPCHSNLSAPKPVSHQIQQICCPYNSLRCLDLQI